MDSGESAPRKTQKVYNSSHQKSISGFTCYSDSWKYRIENCCNSEPSKPQETLIQVSSIAITGSRSNLLPLLNPVSSGHLLDSCNGLLLLWEERKEEHYRFGVCNPITKEYALIPTSHKYNNTINVGLAFDPSVSPHYKIVSFKYLNPDCPALLIFCSKSWMWKALKIESKGFGLTRYLCSDRKSVYFNGGIYKICKELMFKFFVNDYDRGGKGGEIRVGAMQLPSKYKLGKKYCYGVSNGSLCYATVGDNGRNLKIWMLCGDIGDELQCEWMLKHKISCETIGNDTSLYSFYPCAFQPSSDAIFLGCNSPRKYPNIYCYDFTDHKFKAHFELFSMEKLEDFGEYSFYPFIQCKKSLESLPHIC